MAEPATPTPQGQSGTSEMWDRRRRSSSPARKTLTGTHTHTHTHDSYPNTVDLLCNTHMHQIWPAPSCWCRWCTWGRPCAWGRPPWPCGWRGWTGAPLESGRAGGGPGGTGCSCTHVVSNKKKKCSRFFNSGIRPPFFDFFWGVGGWDTLCRIL